MSDCQSDSRTSFACNLGVMSADERARYRELSRSLMDAREERRELDDGYEFRLAPAKISILEVAEWISFERRCCPFFNLQIEAEAHAGPLRLRMTGAADIKEFIRAELGE